MAILRWKMNVPYPPLKTLNSPSTPGKPPTHPSHRTGRFTCQINKITDTENNQIKTGSWWRHTGRYSAGKIKLWSETLTTSMGWKNYNRNWVQQMMGGSSLPEMNMQRWRKKVSVAIQVGIPDNLGNIKRASGGENHWWWVAIGNRKFEESKKDRF